MHGVEIKLRQMIPLKKLFMFIQSDLLEIWLNLFNWVLLTNLKTFTDP